MHKSQPVNNFLGYFRLLITLADKYQTCANKIWLIIIEALLKFDVRSLKQILNNLFLERNLE
jgi:hypothetical protein